MDSKVYGLIANHVLITMRYAMKCDIQRIRIMSVVANEDEWVWCMNTGCNAIENGIMVDRKQGCVCVIAVEMVWNKPNRIYNGNRIEW